MPSKSPAQNLIEKADKKANSSTGWFSSSSTKFEEAGDLYQQAANAFKIDKLFREAGDAHAREAECREKSQETNEAANAWWNAAKAYKRGHPELAIQALTHTITHLTQGGRFRQAADREKEIGQIYLQELNELRKACESFERAGEWYAQEDATAVKEYWLRSSLCALAMGDVVTAKRNLSKYSSLDTTFSSTREAKFVNILSDAVESGDEDTFTGAVYEFDQVTKLDNWKTNILLKIKRGMQDAGDQLR
ncbi:vesicular-fusion protein SEC17 [Amylocystis lapponica]|nr:vesicular-fusion protein SEC17 [Amylocystis lapponica]